MNRDEEEVLIRDDSVLLHDVDAATTPRPVSWRGKMAKTACLSLAFFALGLCIALPGPTLLDLGIQVNATTGQMMVVFASRSVGYLVGAVVGGVLFDCFDKQLLLFNTLLISSVATVAIPWSLTLVVMATMFALQGLTMGALDTGGNIFCVRIWGKKNRSYLQTIHFAFGIGAFIAPLLATPFLSNNAANSTQIVQGNIPVSPNFYKHIHNNRSSRSLPMLFEVLEPGVFIDLDRIVKRSDGEDSRAMADNLDNFIDNLTTAIGTSQGPNISNSNGASKIIEENSESITPKPDSLDTSKTLNGTQDKPVEQSNDTQKNENTDKTTLAPITITGQAVQNQSIPSQTNQSGDSSQQIGNNNATTGSGVGQSGNIQNNNTVPETKPGDEDDDEDEFPKPIGSKPEAATDVKLKPGFADVVKVKDKIPENQNLVPGSSDTGKTGADKVPTTIAPSTNTSTSEISNNTSANVSNAIGNIETLNLNTSSVNMSSSSVKGENNSMSGIGSESSAPPTAALADNQNTSKNSTPIATTLAAQNPPTTTADKVTTTTTQSTTSTTTTITTTPKPTTTTLKPTTTTTTPINTTPKPTTTTPKPTTTTPKPTTPKPTTQKVNTTTHPELYTVPAHNNKGVDKDGLEVKTSRPVDDQGSSKGFTVKKTVSVLTQPSNQPSSPLTTTATTTRVPEKPATAGSFFKSAVQAVKGMSKIQFAYLIVGFVLFVNAIMFLVLYCKSKRRFNTVSENEYTHVKNESCCFKGTLVSFLGFFFFCYVGIEVTYGALVSAFAIEFNQWPKKQGATVAAIFWGSLAVGRGFSIFLARCVGPTLMLMIDTVLMVIGGAVLAFGMYYNIKLLWLGTLILGLGMSSAFPAAISWAEKYFNLTGKATAVFIVGSALGQMVVPVVTGYFYDQNDGMNFMMATFGLSAIAFVIFLFMQCFAMRMSGRASVRDRDGFLPLEDEDEENMELDLVHFDKSEVTNRNGRRTFGNAEYQTLISDLDDD